MQVLINAIDKAVRAGVYNLEETATILNEINKMSALTKAQTEAKAVEVAKVQKTKGVKK
mgnify:CR=1 FL=1|tara:strand:- start:531 stop:707 length:177 start_codon:yes stop_codon:yes gene_type:complete